MSDAERNPCAFPTTRAGFSNNHPLSGGAKLSCVAYNANFINLMTGLPGTLTGAPTYGMDATAGPFVKCATAVHVSFPSFPTAFPKVTFAAIVKGVAAKSFINTATTDTGWRLGTGGASVMELTAAGIVLRSSGLTVSTTDWSLVMCSADISLANFLVKNLATGKTQTAVTLGSGSTANASNGTAEICNDAFNAFNATGIAAGYIGNQLLSLQQLQQIAERPWEFWYPDA